jgi:xanthine dehydrogenase accessory factor
MSELLEQFARVLATRRRAALATLVAAKGTTPKKAGSTMWVGSGGEVLGSVTIGGCVDARVIERAEAVIGSGRPELLSMTLGDEDAWELGLTCGGTVEVLVQRVDAQDEHDPALVAYRAARVAYDAGEPSVVVAALGDKPDRLLVRADGSLSGTLGDAKMDEVAARVAVERLRAGDTSAVIDVPIGSGTIALYFEHLAPPETVVVYGASHVAMSLTVLASELGMRTIVVDGRERYATRERFPHASEIRIGMPSEIAEQLPTSRRTYVVLLAHDYKYELPVLRQVLRGDAGYIGMLGSRRRGATIRSMLVEEGFTPTELARLHSPIGVDIGARSAAEIALAVLAEIVAVREGRASHTRARQEVAAPLEAAPVARAESV